MPSVVVVVVVFIVVVVVVVVVMFESFGMLGFDGVVVGVDSKDKYTKKEENVSNHEHLQFNHNIDHHHTRKTPCAARYDE